jgi:8-oxo-dGTP diphosphatase
MPYTTVGAIILSKDKDGEKILLTRRGIEPYRDHWCLPGGHIDRYETARAAMIREVREETGLDFDARFYRYFDEIIPELEIHAVVLVFTGTATGSLARQESEVLETGWFSADEIHSLPLAFQHHRILEEYFRGD